MWEFYLAGSEAAFRWQDLMVFQIQLTKRNDTLPLTRGYMEKCEKALAMHEIAHQPAAAGGREAEARRRKVGDAQVDAFMTIGRACSAPPVRARRRSPTPSPRKTASDLDVFHFDRIGVPAVETMIAELRLSGRMAARQDLRLDVQAGAAPAAPGTTSCSRARCGLRSCRRPSRPPA